MIFLKSNTYVIWHINPRHYLVNTTKAAGIEIWNGFEIKIPPWE